jgi:hypothetical protein
MTSQKLAKAKRAGGPVLPIVAAALLGGCAGNGETFTRAYRIDSSPGTARKVVRNILEEQQPQDRPEGTAAADPAQQLRWDADDGYLIVRTTGAGHRRIADELARLDRENPKQGNAR